jgi:hypothetical protein
MKRALSFLWLSFVFAAFATGLTPAEAQSFSFKISPVESVVKAGNKGRVKIELKNMSEDSLSLMGVLWGKEDHPELEGFRPIVKNPQGKEPPLTKWGRLVFGRPEAGDNPPNLTLNAVGTYPLEPGTVYMTEVVVSDLYDMSAPGVYTVQISYGASYFGVRLTEGEVNRPRVT